MTESSTAGVRIDRWLCAARIFKSRTQATQACAAGHVKIDDQNAKAHQLVRVGDAIKVQMAQKLRWLEVSALAEKRLSPPLARELYVDHTPVAAPETPRENVSGREPGTGRPTKRERRQLDHLRGR